MSLRRVVVSACGSILGLVVVGTAAAAVFEAGLALGYRGGVGGEGTCTVSEFSPNVPLAVRLGVGMAAMNPGIADSTRRIFINDGTNGTPEKHGRVWDLRFDFLVPIGGAPAQEFRLCAGPRYAFFNGNFRYVGGNEDFDVTSRQWGFGAGVESDLDLGRKTSLVLGGGVDYFLDATLYGHDTSYSPKDENVNSRRDYRYKDADDAVGEPGLEARFLVGVVYRFGR